MAVIKTEQFNNTSALFCPGLVFFKAKIWCVSDPLSPFPDPLEKLGLKLHFSTLNHTVLFCYWSCILFSSLRFKGSNVSVTPSPPSLTQHAGHVPWYDTRALFWIEDPRIHSPPFPLYPLQTNACWLLWWSLWSLSIVKLFVHTIIHLFIQC